MPNYLNIIGEYFPSADAFVTGGADPTVYANIQWVTTPIAQATLDTYDGQEGDTLNSAIVVNEQSFANRQTPIYDSATGQWKNETTGKIFRYNTSPQTFGTTVITIFTDTDIRTDSSLYSYTALPSGTTTVLEDGWYDISYDVTCDATGNSRHTSESSIYVNGSQIPGSLSYGYHRNLANGYDTASGSALLLLNANDNIQLRSRCSSGGNLTTVAGACRIRIEEVG